MFYGVILVALLPAAILFAYVWWVDRYRKEPPAQLAKGFLFGILSAFASVFLASLFEWTGLDVNPGPGDSVALHMRHAFFAAAIPEETCKLLVLWLFLKGNPYFDERLDGIVYATCVGLGFASIENVLYLLMETDSVVATGIMRGLFAVPGHFCFAVIMGYFLARFRFGEISAWTAFLGFWALPVLLHGFYDTAVFCLQDDVGGSFMPAFVPVFLTVLIFFSLRWSVQSMKELLAQDRSEEPPAGDDSLSA